MADLSEVVLFTTKLLHDVAPNPLRGGQLAVFLKTTFPGFDSSAFGARNLRDFVAKNVPDAREMGRAGTDILYGLRQEQQSLFPDRAEEVGTSRPARNAPVDQLLENPKVWRTFASPDSDYQLYLLPDGKLRVLRPLEKPEPHWFRISPITGESLLGIAKDFIAELPQAQQPPLLKCLAEAKWWIPFFEILRNLGLKTRWMLFRRRRIVAEFERSLMNAPAPKPLEARAASVATPSSQCLASSQQEDASESLMRRIALNAVSRMTQPELRGLNLPLGYVMDAISQ